MRIYTYLLLAFSLTTFHHPAAAQDYKKNPGHQFTREDRIELLLDQSKKNTKRAIGALVVGPILFGAGTYIINQENKKLAFPYGGGQNKQALIVGEILGFTGIATTLSSIPLFIISGKQKRAAKLLVSEQSTGYINNAGPVMGVSLRIGL